MVRTKKHSSVFPEKVKQWGQTVAKKSLGLLVVIFGLIGIVALFSYYPSDGSLNTINAEKPLNMLGESGALLSDFLWQGLGIAAIFIPFALVVWGSWVILKLKPRFLLLRFLCFIPALLLLTAAMAAFDMMPAWPVLAGWGGVVGVFCFSAIFNFMDALNFGAKAQFLHIVLACFLLLFSLWLLGFSLALKWLIILKEAYAFMFKVSILLAKFSRKCFDFFKKILLRKKESALVVKDDSLANLKKEKETSTDMVKSSSSKESKEMKKEPIKKEKTSARKAKGFSLPDLDILTKSPANAIKMSKDVLFQKARKLEEAFREYKVDGEVVNVLPGPVVTLYEFNPAFGVRSTRVISLSDEIARSMCAKSVRIAVIPGRSVLGIELPNDNRETVYLRDLLEDNKFQNTEQVLSLALGKNIGGKAVFADLVKMPHLLVAGTTGSGKSVAINTMILSLLYRFSPQECKMIMVDPKMLELSVYNDIPHLLTPVVTEPKKAVVALKWAVKEMEDRYRAMSLINVRNIAKYNEKLTQITQDGKMPTRKVQIGFDDEGLPLMQEQKLDLKPFPHLVVIVDEMADLMLVAGKEVEAAIQRLAQMARAAGIHLIMATQRPSVDVITGTIKANFPTRISFQVTSKIDSRTILGEQGAETLLGRGDMLFMEAGQKPIRIHGPFVSDAEVEKVVDFLKSQGEPEYLDAVTEDDGENAMDGMKLGTEQADGASGKSNLYEEALEIVRNDQKVSISYLQRRLGIGYNKAADIVERMEKDGIVSSPNRTGKREVIG